MSFAFRLQTDVTYLKISQACSPSKPVMLLLLIDLGFLPLARSFQQPYICISLRRQPNYKLDLTQDIELQL